ncbi:MAG TPA: DNA internalization-related competence protein ComEC/Rec2 [Phycisphaerales bacterium]|nr:DNA internalization-related competence protein ComEC/Rec2 [Phycisphaerales bacterium]HMP38041.1 DNA internalization-related competence protein ComEC/Rec2 [Phycisphaerales bacterium]
MLGDGTAATERGAARGGRGGGVGVVVALAMTAGVALGGTAAGGSFSGWSAAGSCACLAALLCALGGSRRAAGVALAVAAGTIATAWSAGRWHRAPDDDIGRLAQRIGDHPTLVRVRGLVAEAPRRQARRGALASFDRRPVRWRVPLVVTGILRERAGPAGAETIVESSSGRLWLSVSGERPSFVPGDSIEALGRLSPFQPPRNPGEFDGRRWARGEGLGGVLFVDAPGLIRPVEPTAAERRRALGIALRGELRSFGEITLEEGLPAWIDEEHRALLRAMFLGRRDDALADLEAAFQRTGAIHLIAISGFNMAVLATTTLLIVRRNRAPRRWNALAVAAVVAAYLGMVDSQPAVLRAGAMILVVCAGDALGRRWSTHGIFAAAAIILLLDAPARLENAGFQLSFAVVAALIWMTPRVRRRWFGPPDLGASTLAATGREALRTALVAALCAWLVSTPLTIHHFGMISPLCAPLSLVAIPLASALLATGYVKMIVTLPAPLLGEALGAVAALLAEALAGLVRLADGVPGAVVHVPRPGIAWALAALAALGVWGLRRSGRGLGALTCVAVILLAWLLWPLRPWRELPILRLDALAVGDGSALLIRSAATAALFDAGGSSTAVGERTIVPALRALGVRRLDAIVISHANLDHYGGLPEVLAAFPVGQLVLTEATLAAAERPRSPFSAALAGAAPSIPVRVARRGDRLRLGAAEWTWLHPPEGWTSRGENDASQVVRIAVGGASLLLCGDIEAPAMERLLAVDGPALRSSVLELPHHGSWHPTAERFVDEVGPTIVVQSTGPGRLRRDRWLSLSGRERTVTALDGACTVELLPDGAWKSARWLDGDRSR